MKFIAVLLGLYLLATVGCSPGETLPDGDPAAGGPVLEQPPPDEVPVEEAAPLEETVKEIEGLVRLADLNAGFIFDLKYATADNFVGKAVYPVAVAVLKKETAERLLQANTIFQADGYSIKIWDAYRPLSVQRLLWQAYPDSRYVINPDAIPTTAGWKARHNNGMAVDMTLVDANGNELLMPSGFDDFSEKGAPDYPGMSEEARRNVQYLISVMESAGFRTPPNEWWHFSDVMGTPTPYLDIPLEAFLD